MVVISLLLLSASVIFVQQADCDRGIALFKAGDTESAAKVLKAVTKKNPRDALSWYYLGLSLFSGTKKKDAQAAFEKAVAIEGDNVTFRNGLAFAHLFRNKLSMARNEALETLRIEPKNSDAIYILGVVASRSGDFQLALEKAKEAIAIRPDFASAHLLKSDMLVSLFIGQALPAGNSPDVRGELLTEAAADLERYIALGPKDRDLEFYRKYLESIRFFANYYSGRAESGKVAARTVAEIDEILTPLKILAKPRAMYTDEARMAGVQGVIRVLVGFSEKGTIEHVLVIKPLGFGLDREAVRAVSNMKFEPAKRNGVPVSIVRVVEYSFTLY
jgi:TonB family protein